MTSLKQRLQRGLACTGAMAVIAVVPLALLAEPAAAAWPSTIKICNNTESTDTNGSNANGKNIDIDRPAGGGFTLYSNELLPGDCTGNVGNPSAVRIDLTDDGANFVPDGSAMIGVDADGIDDSQGAWDMPCVDSITATNENALPIQQSLAEHVPAGGAIKVRVRAARNCGSGLTDHVQVCDHASSADTNGAATDGKNMDVFKTDGSYNNELVPGECTNFKDTDGNNPLKVDLSDDGVNVNIEYDFIQGGYTGNCDEGSSTNFNAMAIEPGDDVPSSKVYRLYAAGSGICGTTIPAAGASESAQELAPTCNPPSPVADVDECEDTSTP